MTPSSAVHQSLVAWILAVIKPLVAAPEDVAVDVVASTDVLLLVIRCDEADVGRVVGRHGHTLAALKVLGAGVAARRNVRFNIEVAGRRARGPECSSIRRARET